MTLLYPLGLLGLLGIPVLILIYIIKNKYTEQTVAATYLWSLSERFLKKRLPINRLAGIISLILQLLAVATASVAIAHPVVTLNGAARDYCFVLDGSGSMRAREEGGARFELAKEDVRKRINRSVSGSTYTLILFDENANTVFDKLSDKGRALDILAETEAGYIPSDYKKAAEAVQSFFNLNPASEIILYTDKTIEGAENIEVVSLGKSGENYAISDVEYEITAGGLKVNGLLSAYGEAGAIPIKLYVDGALAAESEVPAGRFELSAHSAAFRYFRVEQGIADAIAEDDGITVYNVESENMARTLLVMNSEERDPAFFLRAAMTAAGNRQIDAVTAAQYNAGIAGYGLYVFYSFVPSVLPSDGAVWFINPKANLAGTGFSVQDEIGNDKADSGTFDAVYSQSSASAVRNLLGGVTQGERRGFELKKYVKLGLNGNFSTLISCEGNPVLFAGYTAGGNREAVFAFDLADATPFTFSSAFSTIVKNLTDYSFPEVLDRTSYVAGDMLAVNVISGVQSIRIDAPSGRSAYPDTGVGACEYLLSEVGSYAVVLSMKDGSERKLNVYSSLPAEESAPAEETTFVVSGTPSTQTPDGFWDNLLIFFIALAVISVSDFGVYCYEQYQLR